MNIKRNINTLIVLEDVSLFILNEMIPIQSPVQWRSLKKMENYNTELICGIIFSVK